MNQQQIEDFWTDAKIRAGLNPASACTGPNPQDSVLPAVWSLGVTPEEADVHAERVLSGQRTAASSALAEYEAAGAEPPGSGDLSILLDGSQAPRALLRTSSVQVVPFEEVSESHAHAEGWDSLQRWREEFRRGLAAQLPGDAGPDLEPRTPVVLERFEVLVPAGPHRKEPRPSGQATR